MNDLEDQENQKTITISGDYGFNQEQIIPQQTYTSEDNLSDLTFEQVCSWIENKIRIEVLDNKIQEEIEKQKNTILENNKLPWQE